MSVREFAAHLGISDRMVSKWEAGGERIRPRPLNQAALDTSLAMSSLEVKARFNRIAVGQSFELPQLTSDPAVARHLLRHPLDGKLMTLIDAGPYQSSVGRRPIWLPAYYIDVNATSRVEFERFLVAVDGGLSDGDGADVADDPGTDPAARSAASRTGISISTSRVGAAWEDGWSRGTVRPSEGDDAPVTGVTREEATAYARWASKSVSTADEWDRASRGCEGLVASGVAEWCATTAGFVRRGRGKARTGFRCTTPLGDMLALLAI